MRAPQFTARSVRFLAVPVLVAGVAAGTAPGAAAGAGPARRAASFTISGHLSAVAATSASNAWAVGESYTKTSIKTLILRWNGKTWRRVPSPSPGASAGLSGVAAVSARSAWAVGDTITSTGSKTLILRWDGKVWTRVPSPALPVSSL